MSYTLNLNYSVKTCFENVKQSIDVLDIEFKFLIFAFGDK